MMRHKREQERMLYLDSKASQFYRCAIQCSLLCVPKRVDTKCIFEPLRFPSHSGSPWERQGHFDSMRLNNGRDFWYRSFFSDRPGKRKKSSLSNGFHPLRGEIESWSATMEWIMMQRIYKIDIPTRTSSSRMCESYELIFWSGNNLHADNGFRLIDFLERIVRFSETGWKACLSPPNYLIFACDLFFFSRCRLKRRRENKDGTWKKHIFGSIRSWNYRVKDKMETNVITACVGWCACWLS